MARLRTFGKILLASEPASRKDDDGDAERIAAAADGAGPATTSGDWQDRPAFRFSVESRCEQTRARAGRFETPHGVIETPVFMPVGTQATVKALDPEELVAVGAQIILANTYHLHLRPGEGLINSLGGLHQFMAWNAPILTDSGGFQVFSLAGRRTAKPGSDAAALPPDGLVKITPDGVTFTSHIDGSRHLFTPEIAVQIQSALGPDVMMAFDQCAPGDDNRGAAQSAVDRTLNWLKRCVDEWERNGRQTRQGRPQALFGIVQGGRFRELRERATRAVAAFDLPGIAIGGESIGYSKEQTAEILDWVGPLLPDDRPHYAMGVGDPVDFFTVVERGIDLFDSVLPTRIGRHGACFTAEGRIDLTRAAYAEDLKPIDPSCDCPTCRTFSRAYVRHLLRSGEQLGPRLASLHNVAFCLRLTRQIRESITGGYYVDFRDSVMERIGRRVRS